MCNMEMVKVIKFRIGTGYFQHYLLVKNYVALMLSTLGKNFSRQFKIFSYFSQKTGFGISCKVSPLETLCMICQIMFSEKNKKNINLSSAELAQRVVKVKNVLVEI